MRNLMMLCILLAFISCTGGPSPAYDIGTYCIVNNSQYPIVVELAYNQDTIVFNSNPIAPNSMDTVLKKGEGVFGHIGYGLQFSVFHHLETDIDTVLYTHNTKENIDLWEINDTFSDTGLLIFTFEFNDNYIAD